MTGPAQTSQVLSRQVLAVPALVALPQHVFWWRRSGDLAVGVLVRDGEQDTFTGAGVDAVMGLCRQLERQRRADGYRQ